MTVNSIRGAEYYYPQNQIKFRNNEEVFSLENKNENDMFVRNIPESSGNNEKVSFGEGLKLVFKGFVNKVNNMVSAVVNHPLRTLAAVGATTLALSALPLIGITAATGAAVLALGFAAFAVGKTVVDVAETIKDNKEGRYNEVRDDLEKIGGDGVDLAMSLPFVPKAARQVTRFAKYGTSTVGLNTELISNLKNVHSIKEVPLEFAKAETLINYEMVGNEMGLAVKPKLVFKDMNVPDGIVGGAYEPTTGELQVNQNLLSGRGKIIARHVKFDTETLLRHELEHFRQFSDIARTEGIGIDGLEATITEYYNSMKGKVSVKDLERQGLSSSTLENMTSGDKSAFNRQFYQDVVDSQGTIQAGTKEADLAAQYAHGLLEKVNPRPEHIAQFERETRGITRFAANIDPSLRKRVLRAQMNLYKANILEKEAYAAQEAFQKANVLGRPGIVISNAEVIGSVTPEEDEKIKK